MNSIIDNTELYKLLVEASPNALILSDEAGKILLFNNYAEKLFQYSEKEIIGQSIDLLVPGKYAEQHSTNRNNYLRKPVIRSMGQGRDLFAQRKDKSEFPAEIGLNPIIIENKKFVLATVINISERKKHENEIKRRNKQLAGLSYKLTQANDLLEVKNRNISESIEYARKIQLSILPEKTELTENFKNFTLFYQPKDIIGGDIYWFKKTNNSKYIAAIDCTGHGVPGAMLSILVFSLLNDVVEELPYAETGQQLELLHTKLYSTLQQDKGENYSQDGCDISLCKIVEAQHTIQFSGARQNLYLYNGNELKIIKSTPKSIGGYSILGLPESNRTFKTENLNITKPTVVAMATDGIVDQLDKNDKVFGYKNFHQLLISNFENLNSDIEKNITDTMNFWTSETEQLDDMLIIMFKV